MALRKKQRSLIEKLLSGAASGGSQALLISQLMGEGEGMGGGDIAGGEEAGGEFMGFGPMAGGMGGGGMGGPMAGADPMGGQGMGSGLMGQMSDPRIQDLLRKLGLM